MANFNAQPIIDILAGLVNNLLLDAEQIDDAIDALERIKGSINVDDDEVIDKVDEMQDYLEYLLTVKEPLIEEIREELSAMIDDLRKSFS